MQSGYHPAQGIMSSCEDDEGEQRRREGEEGATDFFNGIFKDGFRLEVISLFMFRRRKLKNCVCLCARLHLYVRAGSNYSVLQAFKPTTI